jgi:hypothetical protein
MIQRIIGGEENVSRGRAVSLLLQQGQTQI